MAFKVKEIEFESCSDWKNVSMYYILGMFSKEAVRYIPTFASAYTAKMDCKGDKGILGFKKAISLNTISNILSQMNKKYSSIEIEEIEYKPENKRVEVEVK